MRLHRRVLALVVAAVLALGGCALEGDDDPTLDLGEIPPGGGTTAPGQMPGSGDDGEAGGGGAAPPPPAAPGTTAPSSNGTPPAPPTALGPPGSFAPALLQPQSGVELVVELLVQNGAEPTSATVDHVIGTLRRESGKSVRSVGGVVAGDDRSWTADELRAAADAASGRSQGGGAALLRLLFVRGGFEGNDQALGIAVRGDVAAVFTDRVAEAGSLLAGDRLERAVALHEVGHLLGLVDLYLDTGRADAEHPGHSSNEESVMYWAVESSLVGQLLTGGAPTEFDAADRQDLARIRSGA